MSHLDHHFTVNFASVDPPDPDVAPGSAEAESWLFGRDELILMSTIAERRELDTRPNTLSTEGAEALKAVIRDRIVHVIQFLAQWFDLKKDDWKTSPVVWQKLSFSNDAITSADAPILSALHEAVEASEDILRAAGISDLQDFKNSLDLVVHQVFARRNAILATAEYSMDEVSAAGDLLDADVDHLLERVAGSVGDALRCCKERTGR